MTVFQLICCYFDFGLIGRYGQFYPIVEWWWRVVVSGGGSREWWRVMRGVANRERGKEWLVANELVDSTAVQSLYAIQPLPRPSSVPRLE